MSNTSLGLLTMDLFAVVLTVIDGYTLIETLLWGIVLLSGGVGAIGGAYLLYMDTIIVHYTRFFKIITVGLFIFVLTAPVVFLMAVEFIHGVHGFAALVISMGLYTLLREEPQPDEDFASHIASFPQDEGPEEREGDAAK